LIVKDVDLPSFHITDAVVPSRVPFQVPAFPVLPLHLERWKITAVELKVPVMALQVIDGTAADAGEARATEAPTTGSIVTAAAIMYGAILGRISDLCPFCGVDGCFVPVEKTSNGIAE
jgi:hypothetical protein